MNMRAALLISILTFVTCGSGKPAGPPLESPREALLLRLTESVSSGKIMYGHQDDLVYGHSWKVEDVEGDALERSDVKAVSGKYPAVVGFDLGGIELGDSKNLDDVPFDLIRRSAVVHASRGGIVTFSWHPRNPLTGGDAWDISSDKVVESVLEGGKKSAEFRLWLTRLGDFLASLKDDNGRPIPFVFRPWHENIGSWFWWGGKFCTAEQYIALYRMTWSALCEERGISSIVWCYSPNSNVSPEQYMERYPGDGYVDMLGIDCYEYQGNRSVGEAGEAFIREIKESLGMLKTLSEERGKLMCLSETGFESIPDHRWWTEILHPAISLFPITYVLTWRNAHDKPTHYYAPWPGSPDAEDFQKFTDKNNIEMLSVKKAVPAGTGAPVTYYEFMYKNSRAYPILFIRLERTEDGVARLGYSDGNNDITWIRVGDEVFQTVGDMIRQYKLRKLKRDYMPRFDIRDGNSWHLYAGMGKDSVSSSGYHTWPSDKLRAGIDAINGYLGDLVKGASEEDILEVTQHYDW